MKKMIIPLLVLAIGVGLGKFIIATGPEPQKKTVRVQVPVVEAQALALQDYQVNIAASGVVRAQTQTNLVAEVSGKILEISPKFKEGGYFNRGDVLLRIDDTNYRNAVTIAEAEVAQQQLNLAEQQAQAKLAAKDWNLFDKGGTRQQDDFAARRPHIAAATANIEAAKARVGQEKLNLARTRIKAPYAGRVQEQRVDVGQYVTPGTVLGVIYATDYVEVHLPLSLAQYELLNIPEAFRDKDAQPKDLPEVEFYTSNSNGENVWKGQVVRSSAALDEQSRQINVIARIDKPYESASGASKPIRIGQYVKARIQGETFRDVYVLPPASVRQGKEILLAEDGRVRVVPVTLLWNTEKEMVVRADEDLTQKQLITTPLPLAVNGSPVEILGASKRDQQDKLSTENPGAQDQGKKPPEKRLTSQREE